MTLIVIIASKLGAPVIIINILISVVLCILYVSLLLFVFHTSTTKNKYRSDITLYQWMDDLTDFDEGLVYSLKKYNVEYSTINNLNNIKSMLIKLTNNNKSKLKMYRAFYKQQSKETGEELYLKTILVSLIPIGIFVFRDNIPDQVNIFVISVLLLTVFITIAFISDKLSSNKKRTGILIELIDLCIEEIEDEENRIKEYKYRKEEGKSFETKGSGKVGK